MQGVNRNLAKLSLAALVHGVGGYYQLKPLSSNSGRPYGSLTPVNAPITTWQLAAFMLYFYPILPKRLANYT